MRFVWKKTFDTEAEWPMQLPVGAQILCVQMQRGLPTLWFLCDADAPLETVTMRIYGTGQPMPDEPGEYIGTYQLDGGALVFHVFKAP